jgi:putative phage-type endonuclease
VTRHLGAARLLGQLNPDEAKAWETARSARLGGSEVAAVLGLSPWQSPFSLWHRKAGNVGPQPENESMALGRLLEPVIGRAFAELHPELRVCRTGTWVHRDRSWQLASPDWIGYATGRQPVIVEGKVADDDWAWGEEGTDGIPPYYLTQCRWYLDVFGFQRCHLLALFLRGREFREYVIDADPADQAFMRRRGEAFMQSVKDDAPPPLDAHLATYRAIRELHPDIDGGDVQIAPELAATYRSAAERLAAAKAEHQLQTSRIAAAMGTAQRALVGAEVIARRQAKTGGTPYVVRATPTKQKDTAA